MPFRQDFAQSARRHLRAAQRLHESDLSGDQPGCRAVAGYLFGLAGELAFKEMMRASGMRPLPADRRADDPFWQHFPTIRTLIIQMASRRRQRELWTLAQDPNLFQNWDIAMRYGKTSDIREEWVSAWQRSAEQLVERMAL